METPLYLPLGGENCMLLLKDRVLFNIVYDWVKIPFLSKEGPGVVGEDLTLSP